MLTDSLSSCVTRKTVNGDTRGSSEITPFSGKLRPYTVIQDGVIDFCSLPYISILLIFKYGLQLILYVI